MPPASRPAPSGIRIEPDVPLCQTDLPLDWYQEEFKPYAEEYLALADRKPQTVLPWMDRYIRPALAEFGDQTMLLAHYYMGGEIVKLVERYGGRVADSYQLARQTALHPEKKIFVESAVHFMAEAIALLAAPDQQVYITNPKSGCTMEMMAKDFMVAPALEQLQARYGDQIMVVAYMNTSGRIKAMAGRTGGAVCTSSNAARIVSWALEQGRKIFFVPDQQVYITNPKSGCTMEMMAKDFMVKPAFEKLRERYGDEILVVAYMNTSGRVKALAGATGGAVCTSSNAAAILGWALAQGRKIFFVPDQHLGRNVAAQVGIPEHRILLWPGGHEGGDVEACALSSVDEADLVLWGSFCGVHTIFRTEHVEYWRRRGFCVLVHPECPREVVAAADGAGSTAYLWNEVLKLASGTRVAVGTEGHFVRNLHEQGALRGIEVVHLADLPDELDGGCGCATMSRNDPPHLVALLDLLRRGQAPDANRVLAGDVVDEVTGWRERLSPAERDGMARDARRALERMIEITDQAG